MVLALEVGGRWSREAWAFVRCLAAAQVREELPLLRRRALVTLHRRFVCILAVASQRAFGESLLEWLSGSRADGAIPSTQSVPADARYAGPEEAESMASFAAMLANASHALAALNARHSSAVKCTVRADRGADVHQRKT